MIGRFAFALSGIGLLAVAAAAEPNLGPLARCALGQDCFVQQFADVLVTPDYQDPFCNRATYDGHDGIDLRVLTMAEVARGVDVLAVGDGTVLRRRDGVVDRLPRNDADRAAIKGQECGNGIILDLGGGYEAQYCHLKKDSIVVKSGDKVTRGQPLAQIGASGMAEFPHVHLTLRKDGQTVEPMTGKPLAAGGCAADASPATSLFAPDVAAAMGRGTPQILLAGFAPGPVEEAAVVSVGLPPAPSLSTPVVGWGWAINLAKGDIMMVRLLGPDGTELAKQATQPMDRSKATYLAFAGLRRATLTGAYKVEVTLMRGGQVLLTKSGTAEIR